jgi:sugar (pentulose or hexulose) kinase
VAAEHLLALDAGTSGARCLIVRPGTGVVASARRDWSYEMPPEIAPFGRAIDTERFWSVLCDAARSSLADANLSGSDIAAIAVTAQRLAVVIVDRDGRSLYAGPNIDVRALREGLTIDAQYADRVYRSCGKLPALLLAPARVQWLRNQHPDDFARAAAVLTLGDWMAYQLTGELRAERTLNADSGLLDVTTGERARELPDAIEVPAALLPPLVSPGEAVGHVTKAVAEMTGLSAGTPVVIAGSDTQVALCGLGIERPGDAGIAAGWSCPLQQVTDAPRFDAAKRTWVCIHPSPDRWTVESSATDAGRIWRWWCDLLAGDADEASALAAQAAPGAAGLTALLGPRAMNAAAMGPYLGGLVTMTPVNTEALGQAELLRAALENIGFALRANLEQAQEVSGLPAGRIATGGGLTRASAFASIVASVFGRPIDVATEVDVTGWGAARIAGRTIGIEVSPAPSRCVEPDPAAVETYARLYERWRRLGDGLDALREGLP